MTKAKQLASEIHNDTIALLAEHRIQGQKYSSPQHQATYSAEGLKTLAQKFSAEYLERAAAIQQKANALADSTAQNYRDGLDKFKTIDGDATAQLLGETRAGKAWARIKAELDAGKGDFATKADQLGKLLTSGDQTTRHAILTEGPSYLRASGWQSHNATADEYLEGILTEQDEHLSDLFNEAASAANLRTTVNYNAGAVTQRLSTLPPDATAEPRLPALAGYVDPTTVREVF